MVSASGMIAQKMERTQNRIGSFLPEYTFPMVNAAQACQTAEPTRNFSFRELAVIHRVSLEYPGNRSNRLCNNTPHQMQASLSVLLFHSSLHQPNSK